MISDLLKWIVPGLATVLGSTTLCLAMTSTDITNDLAARSTATMQRVGEDWAELVFDMRDVTVSGTTTHQAAVDAVLSELVGIPGIGSVTTTAITLAPLASPYRLEARLENGAVALTGGVPDEWTRLHLLARAGLEQGDLELRSGMPDRAAWVSGAEFAIDQLRYLDQGQVTIAGLAVDLAGRAKSERDYRDLLLIMRAGPPAGLTLGEVEIAPPLVSPYNWSAVSNGKRIDITGFVPDQGLVERLRMADVAGLPVATGLALGSGEPTGFADLSQRLIEQLARLEYGSATISDGESTLSGAPATVEIAQAVITELGAAGSIVVLEPPLIDDYWVSATLQPGGLTVFDGYAPDEATRTALGQRQGADITWLKLGRGAPERYQSAVDFGLAALGQMSEGRFALRDNVVTLTGTARSSADYAALMATIAQSAPQGIVLAPAEIVAPRSARYQWSATKTASGQVTLTGMVPDPDVEAALLAAAGADATAAMAYASGEPKSFASAARTGLSLLQRLSDGNVGFDGAAWLVTGTALTPADKVAIEADFETRQLASAGWSMAVAAPAAPVAQVEPTQPSAAEAPAASAPADLPAMPAVNPAYSFSATRAADGSVVLGGQLPAEAALRYFATITQGDVAAVTLSEQAPDSFLPSAETGLRALLQLSQGQLDFVAGGWSLRGSAADAAIRDAVVASLAADSAATWTAAIDISPPAPEPVATIQEPQPAAARVDIAACQGPLAEFSARNAILFQSGAAIIAAESAPALDQLAIDLGLCPDAVVNVEGHTDADGDEQLNLALSVARAEAVVEALVERGIAQARLYALGYGESVPIADNDTSAGKQLNRRIVVTVTDEHY